MNRLGTYTGNGIVLTYQIGENAPTMSYTGKNEQASATLPSLTAKRMGNYQYWPAGPNNNDPDVCAALIKGNRLLPSLIEKQVAILYGTGPMLYTEKINDDGTVSRHYLKDPEIEAWLESWQKAGIPNSYKEYLRKNIRSYYYSEGIFSQWLLSKGTVIGLKGNLPVAGLKHISELRVRLATVQDIARRKDIGIMDRV